ncbi:MAG: TetR/AcrR family transcriptional regulator [Candidatus Acidiferrum sp.]|jgi:AcrR family transcriptional regulator
MPRKADKSLESRIIDVAYQLWVQGGERALTMRAVAQAAKTTTPTLYERFKDKHDLVVFLRERARTRLFQALQPAKTGAEACELGLKFVLAHGNEYLLLTADWAQRLGRRETLPSYEFVKARLAEDLGGVPENHARLALSLVALIHGTAIMILGEGVDGAVSQELEAACLDACRRLIKAAGNGHDGRVKDKELEV